jgi:hypothetical protein
MVEGQHNVQVRAEDVACDINFLAPMDLTFTQTNQYDPKPRERFKLLEWHLTGRTTAKKKSMEFITLYRPHRTREHVPNEASLEKIKGGYALEVKLSDGEFSVLLPTDDKAVLKANGLTSAGAIKARLKRENKRVEILGLDE